MDFWQVDNHVAGKVEFLGQGKTLIGEALQDLYVVFGEVQDPQGRVLLGELDFDDFVAGSIHFFKGRELEYLFQIGQSIALQLRKTHVLYPLFQLQVPDVQVIQHQLPISLPIALQHLLQLRCLILFRGCRLHGRGR